MVVAMLLVAALVVAPAAAAREISGNGSTVFIGEKDVNLDKIFGYTDVNYGQYVPNGTLVYYSSITGGGSERTGTIEKTISVVNTSKFELTTTDFGSLIGQWYAFQKGADDLTALGKANGSILVQKPVLDLDVKLAKIDTTYTDSVNGKTVTRASNISFELEHNLGITGLDEPFKVDIEVTTPSGGKLTTFGANDVELKGLELTGQKNVTTDYSDAIDLKGLDPGTYTAIAKWPSTSDFYDKGYNSNTVTFEILTKAIAISSNKDSVVRGNNFVVTITGESKADYWVFVKDAAIGANEYPVMLAGQPGVNTTVDDNGLGVAGQTDLPASYAWNRSTKEHVVNDTIAVVNTKADGTRTIEFKTTGYTDDRQFTIRVQELKDSTKYDDVKVRVEEGDVTITASGTGVYYIGEEITLSGTCTDNKNNVYLFLTGPNLPAAGVNLTRLDKAVSDQADTFTEEEVEADDTWSYKWNTADLADEAVRSLDAGGYTIYAVSQPKNKDDLSQAKYATAAIQLKTGFLTATSSGAKIAKGDDLKITGTAMGDPDNVFVWIFGKNKQILGESATVESDGSFEYELKGGDTKDWSAGQYFAVVQHPMMDKKQGIKAGAKDTDYEGWIVGEEGSGFKEVKIRALQASDAANALIQALDSPNIDDTYVKLTFDVEEPYIFIDPIGIKEAGSKFTITGTTNVAVGDKLIIDVTSAAFGPTKKTEASGFGAVSGNVVVEKGDGANKWSFEVDASDLKPDQYIVKVECIETDTTATANFNLVEAVETTPTTEVETTAPVGEETTTVPAGEETTEPTPTPGFGALVALAGLGAVAFLVLRRK
jgi:PGF-CTERM protein